MIEVKGPYFVSSRFPILILLQDNLNLQNMENGFNTKTPFLSKKPKNNKSNSVSPLNLVAMTKKWKQQVL